MFHMISFYNQMINIHQKVTKFSHQDEHNISQISGQHRQETKQKTARWRKTHVHRGSSYIVRAENGARTRDLRLGKPTLYQLSYFRIFPWKGSANIIIKIRFARKYRFPFADSSRGTQHYQLFTQVSQVVKLAER